MAIEQEIEASYKVRLLTPADAAAIPELTTRVNGPGYIHAEVYHPQQLLRMNETGQLVSVVALQIEEDVVGHCALERPDLGRIAESGEAMVLPEHRHHHLLDKMRDLLEQEGTKIGLAGIFGNAVTHHVFSQRTEERSRACPTAIKLGASPAQAHRIEGGYPQRVSLLSYFKYLCPLGQTLAHLPAHHREIAGRIYGRLGRRLRFGNPRRPHGTGKLTTSYDPPTQQGVIQVLECGADSAEQIAAARGGLFDNFGAEVVYLELPINRPESAELCVEAERRGSFFSGFCPQAPEDGDMLRLQCLKRQLDLALLQIEGELARDILAYIGHERSRVAS